VSYHPFVDTKHPNMDVVIVRENEEDLYAGIEYQMTPEVTSCIKLISRPGSEKIVRYAFDYARLHNRKKVTCFMKDNIMKMTDGLFHKVFDEIGAAYPEIEKEVWIVDIGAAKMADTPEAFDVIVMPNLYGDILSDVAAQIAGSVGLAGSANIGDQCAMFEAIHGSAPRRAGQNLANPSGLLLGGVLMLVHINQPEAAERVHNAWLRTIEDGVHTYDIYTEGVSSVKVGTKEFAAAVVERLGQKPNRLKPVVYKARPKAVAAAAAVGANAVATVLKGIDVFVYWPSRNPNTLAEAVGKLAGSGLTLQVIDNRGVKVWPAGIAETFCTDSFRCRFLASESVDMRRLLDIPQRIAGAGIDIALTQTLRSFDGQTGYSMVQGH
jgi:isocitrate dehydrogenase